MSKMPTNKHHQTFEDACRRTENGAEFWSARELLSILDYGSWDKFKAVIHKSISACENSGMVSSDHFSQMGKMV